MNGQMPMWVTLLAVGCGGAVGAISRFGVGLVVVRWNPQWAPLGTLIVNVVGCFLIGMLVALATHSQLGPLARPLLVTGLCGGLTTFSTFGYEALWLSRTTGHSGWAFAYVAANLLLGIGCVWLGEHLVTSSVE